MKIQHPLMYKKAYGESHSYNEMLKNIELHILPDYFLVNQNNKIISSFASYNLPKWATNLTENNQDMYNMLSYYQIKGIHIDIDNLNSWDNNKVTQLIQKYN
jgi:hypothetical protein